MRNRGITGSTLKIIAMVAMFIDHIGATIFARMLMATGLKDLDTANTEAVMAWVSANADAYGTYTICRMIGRIAFPIFCFLLVEGFVHTSDRKKYAIRLAAFALISEIPFDLAFQSKMIEFTYQNVFFTLAIGFVTLIAYKKVEEKEFQNRFTQILCQILVGMIGMAAAQFLRTDYGAVGVMAIVLFYVLRENRFYQIASGCILFIEEMTALFAFLPILIYNGKRGSNVKWAFYIFYPAHLLILFAICYFMGLAGYSAI